MNTLKQFIARNKISMTADRADGNPNMDYSDPEWARSASHWKCTIIGPKRRKLTTYFSQGSAITSEPTAADVLDCLASDCSSVEDRSFEEWATETGWNTDSRKAERTYKICKRHREKLGRLLGPELYATLLFNTERL